MNIPNMLTLFRILLIPVFVAVFNSSTDNSTLIALGIFLLAGLTDLLDGYIARKYNMITRLGTLLDPLADKLMLVTVLICLALKDYFPLWIAALVIIKEGLMIGGGMFLYYSKRSIVIPANLYGKAATAGFYLAVILLSISRDTPTGQIMLYVAVLLTVGAFLRYLSIAITEMKKPSEK